MEEVPLNDDGQVPLTGWVELYDELCEAERLLAEADDRDAAPLRARVEQLSLQVDEALREFKKRLEQARPQPE